MTNIKPRVRTISTHFTKRMSRREPCTVHLKPEMHGANHGGDGDELDSDSPIITKPVRVAAHMKNRDTGKFSTQLIFGDIQNHPATIWIPRGTSPSQTLKELLEHGAHLPLGFDGGFAHDSRVPVLEGTGRTGWHQDKAQFLMPRGSVGGGSEPLQFIPASKSSSERGLMRGKWRAWTRRMKEPLNCSSYLTMVAASVFAAPMLEITDVEETMSFNLWGDSGAGKTLAFKVGESIMGPCSEKNLVTMNLTDRALNDQMYAHNGMTMFVNELKNADGRLKNNLTSLSHVLTSGAGFDRSNYAKRASSDLEKRSWIVLGMTNFEKSLEDISGGNRDRGERARHIDIPVPTPAQGGIFDQRPEVQPAADEMRDLVAKILTTIDAHHGAAFQKYLRCISNNRDEAVRMFRSATEAFIEIVVIDQDDSWYRRFARKFGYVYAGGILAIKAGVLPVTPEMLLKMIRKLHSLALAMFQHPEEMVKGVVARIIEGAKDRARFPKIELGDGAPSGYDACDGFYRAKGKRGRVLAVKGDTLKSWCQNKEVREMVVIDLQARGALTGGRHDAMTTQVKIKGAGRHGYYLIGLRHLRSN